MLVTVKAGADPERVRAALIARGLWVDTLRDSAGRTTFAIAAHSAAVSAAELEQLDGVDGVAVAKDATPLVSAQAGKLVTVAGAALGAPGAAGGAPPVVIAGPCSVESEAQIHALAARAAGAGVKLLRGGAFKPRSSPYAFQGHGAEALGWLRAAADAHDLGVVTECLAVEDAPAVARVADLVQIGSRNMQHVALLRAASAQGRPVLLKRGMAATLDEWLAAAEYCLLAGAPAVVFCERGVRGFDASTRNLIDLGAVALLAHVRRLPVIVDPSHGAGRRDLIAPLGRAALAAGAAGVMIETHADPGRALSDGPQAVPADALGALVAGITGRSTTHA